MFDFLLPAGSDSDRKDYDSTRVPYVPVLCLKSLTKPLGDMSLTLLLGAAIGVGLFFHLKGEEVKTRKPKKRVGCGRDPRQ